jgi:hypothetical protein
MTSNHLIDCVRKAFDSLDYNHCDHDFHEPAIHGVELGAV